ncbi:MAG: hypothetical protein ACK8QZ_09250 [Anaerolineales bacterium]
MVESDLLTDAETLALAQFVKRVVWFEFSSNAGSADEAFLINAVFDKLLGVLTRSAYVER